MKMVCSQNKTLLLSRFAMIVTIGLAFGLKAHAGVATMPWDAGLKSMALDLAGPVAWTIGVIGVVMGASSVVIHHELTGFALIRLGRIYEMQNRNEEAVDIYKTVLRSYPQRDVASQAKASLKGVEL